MAGQWQNDRVMEVSTGRTWRVLERYMLPGKHTGFVLVCSNRACFTEIRGYRHPLGRLPDDMSPEERASVVAWAAGALEQRTRDAFRYAVTGEKPPLPIDGVDGNFI